MAYTNEEYYDMLMILGECHGQHYPAARRYAELYPNCQRHPSSLSYSERLKDCTKPAVSYQIITTLVEIVSQEIYKIEKYVINNK